MYPVSESTRGIVDVSFITVNYFSASFTERCVESIIRETKGLIYEILVVDNASGFDAASFQRKFPGVRVFLSPTNLGYGSALHLATSHARGYYYYFLNNDTELKNDVAALQSAFCRLHPEVGLTGVQLFDVSGKPALSFDYFPTLLSKFVGTHVLRLLRPAAYPRRDKVPDGPLEVPLVSGASLFMPAAIYQRIQGFDTQFFLYCEEEDLALRVHGAGYKVVLIPAARIQHVGGASSRDILLLKKEFYISFFKFYHKHYGATKTKILKSLCLGQFACRSITRSDRKIWRSLMRWWMRGAPLTESLRALPGNENLMDLQEAR